MSEKGFITIIYLIAAAAALGALYGIYHTIDRRGYERGVNEIKADWDDANRKAQEAADKEAAARDAETRRQAAALEAANGRARDADARWRAEIARAGALTSGCSDVQERVSATVGDNPGVAAGSGLRADPSGGRVPVHFLPAFVRLYDRAWTGADGQPVFPDTGIALEASLAASPVSAADVLRVHGENAARCSEDRRTLTTLIQTIERLRDQPAP